MAELLKRGHLNHLLSKSNKKFPEQEHNTSSKGTPTVPPQHAKVINFISGGSCTSGASYSAAKRHTRALVHSANITLPEDDCNESREGPITFQDDEVNDPTHDDALVISITLSNCGVKRVLVDPGSSVNIIYLATVKEMNMESEMSYHPTTLVFGNGAADKSMAIINLPTYAVGMNQTFTYHVMDCPSSYNAILGRPWLHKMKAVPSTLHQKIKFDTPWGVRQIRGDQLASRECYQATLKISNKSPA